MKRFLASALIIGVSTFSLVGCGEETKVEEVKTTTTPTGTEKETKTEKVETSGSNPPAPAAADPAAPTPAK